MGPLRTTVRVQGPLARFHASFLPESNTTLNSRASSQVHEVSLNNGIPASIKRPPKDKQEDPRDLCLWYGLLFRTVDKHD